MATSTRPKYRYIASIGCANGHLTETPVLNATVEPSPEGDMVSGVMGSAADFCDVCDTDEVTVLAIVDRGQGEV